LFIQTNNNYNDYANYVHLFVILHHIEVAHDLVLHSAVAAVDFVGDVC